MRLDASPPEGCLRQALAWVDLLEDEPPWRRPPPLPAYCVPAVELVEGGLRIEPVLVVTAAPEGPLLEERLCVTRRTLSEAIERERARVGARVTRASDRLDGWRARHRHRSRELRRAGGPSALLGVLLAWMARLLHRTGEGALRGARALTRGLATFPDRVRTGLSRSVDFLDTPGGRRRYLEGLKDPRGLTPRQKAVTLFTTVGGLFVVLLLVHAAVTLSLPQHAVGWRRVFLLFVYALVTSLGPPFPLEPAIFAAAHYVGRVGTLVTVLGAKVLAAWMIFFVGDEVNDRLREKARTSPRMRRMLAWSEAFARRFGIVALATFIAVPGLPDVVALYVFGTLHMRLPGYLLGVLVGSFILNSLILYGLGPLFGV